MTLKLTRKFDLNLFIIFVEIFATRSITQASYNLGLTQPAVSNALNRLRKQLNDQLFVRSPNGMSPTPLALQIAPVVKQTLTSLSSIIDESFNFDPVLCKKVFTIAMTEYGATTILNTLMPRLINDIPNATIKIVRLDQNKLSKQLFNGDIDLALSSEIDVTADIYSTRLFTDNFVCMVDKNHSTIKNKIDMEDFVKNPHVLYTPHEGKWGIVDNILKELDMHHRNMVYTSHASAIPGIIRDSSLLTVIPERLAISFQTSNDFKIFQPPIKIPGITLSFYWHLRTSNDPATSWLRNMVSSYFKNTTPTISAIN